jgi:hypothetical protein
VELVFRVRGLRGDGERELLDGLLPLLRRFKL